MDAAVDWGSARAALGAEAARVSALLRSVRDPSAPALGDWTIAELAAHLSHAWTAVPALARHERGSPIGELGELAGLTRDLVAAEPVRDLGLLADLIDEAAAGFLDGCASRAATDRSAWLVDRVSVDLTLITCHLLNESVVHAYDIARADGRRWRVDRRSAALVVTGFILPLVRTLDPASFVRADRAAGVHASYEVRLRGGQRFRLTVDDGKLFPGDPDGPVDCRIGADPAALLLLLWGRESLATVLAKGGMVAWGRRPWLAPRLPAMLRNP